MTRTLSRSAALSIALLLVINATAFASTQSVSSRLEAYIKAAAEVHEFSGAISVAGEDGVLYEGCFGHANLEHNAPNTPDTKFRIGSVAKPFTATAIMRLQEQGKLKVQDPISKYISDAPEAWSEITIHHLLTHTSGIRNYTEIPELMQKTVRLPATVDDVIKTFRDMPLDFSPGEKFDYCNSGYILLGKIIEEASGRPYEDFLREEVLAPLGLNDTGYDRGNRVLSGRAAGYVRRPNGNVENAPYMDTNWAYAAGALYSTLRDMQRWDRALRDGKLLSKESYQAMYTPDKAEYGYGWSVQDEAHGRVISHTGGIHGFQSMIVRYVDEKITVIMLCNVVRNQMGEIADDLAKITRGEDVANPKPKVAVKINPASFDGLAGRYQLGPERVLSFRRDGERFFTHMTGQSELEIFPSSETEFFLKVVPARLTFIKDGNGKATHVILHQGGREHKAPRIEGESP